MEEVSYIAHPDLEQILETEQATYEYIGAGGKKMKIVSFLIAFVIFSIVILFHELGHFCLQRQTESG